jgi:hypothetical protein
MSHKILSNATFHLFLNKIDQELTEEIRKKGCPCGGKLHRSNYPRSPVGLPSTLRDQYQERLSLCCDTCRKRITPPSVRFFGRRWFPAPFFVLICALTLGINERRLEQVKRHLGIKVSESTWKRWRRWWREVFQVTKFWQQVKGLIPSLLGTQRAFPRDLLTAFKGKFTEKLCLLLRFLAPLTSGILQAV